MGTMFYVGGEAVGKRSSLGEGNGCKFIWAMHQSDFYQMVLHTKLCQEELDVPTGTGMNERDCDCSCHWRDADFEEEWNEAHDAILECVEFEYDMIGFT